MSAAKRMMETVIWFNASRGSGFITPNIGSGYLYFHHPSLKSDGSHGLNVGDSIEFEVCTDRHGRLTVVDVTTPGGGAFVGYSRPCRNEGDQDGFGLHALKGSICTMHQRVESQLGPTSTARREYLVDEDGNAHSLFDEMPLEDVIWDSDEVFDETTPADVVWDEDSLHRLDFQDGVLPQLHVSFLFVLEVMREMIGQLEEMRMGQSHVFSSPDELILGDDEVIMLLERLDMDLAHKAYKEMPSMGLFRGSFTFMLGMGCGVYVAQNYNVPNVKKLFNTYIFLAKHIEETYRKPKKDSDD
ncbi:hypothetical protein PR202_ga27900 [Eleusine coracana subsp. coracana]|uniref:CSD domain-containing protein n=1 Tax=Eleusine coracana subsp. coracana TaxID=191504 RepID=A0AAV5DI35_ELECO|nr:hypothetical protein PR202_ga27900 [Eleusine coracana subsp. coracana]